MLELDILDLLISAAQAGIFQAAIAIANLVGDQENHPALSATAEENFALHILNALAASQDKKPYPPDSGIVYLPISFCVRFHISTEFFVDSNSELLYNLVFMHVAWKSV